MIEFFNFWVEGIWGGPILSLFGTAFIFAVIGVLGRMSYFLLFSLLALYFVVFGIGFFGMIFFLPIFLFAIIYFFIQIYRFTQGAD